MCCPVSFFIRIFRYHLTGYTLLTFMKFKLGSTDLTVLFWNKGVPSIPLVFIKHSFNFITLAKIWSVEKWGSFGVTFSNGNFESPLVSVENICLISFVPQWRIIRPSCSTLNSNERISILHSEIGYNMIFFMKCYCALQELLMKLRIKWQRCSWISDFSIVHIINQCNKFNNFVQKTGRKDFGGVSIMHDGY